MDFAKVLESYQEKDVDRSYGAYVQWLTGPKYGIQKEIAEKAILTVFGELEQGKVFQGDEHFAAPHFLDQYVRDTALKFRDEWAKEESVKMESFFNNLLQVHKDKAVKTVLAEKEKIFKDALAELQKPLNWVQKFIKKLFRL